MDLSQRPFVVRGSDTVARAHSLIIATGATAKRLGIPSEQRYWSSGISACAICDGASPIFKGQELAVVGGGDTATEEAVYLTKYGRHVHLLVRGERLRASAAMADRVASNPKITVHLNTRVEDAEGDGKAMTGLRLVDSKTGEGRVAEGALVGAGGCWRAREAPSSPAAQLWLRPGTPARRPGYGLEGARRHAMAPR